MFVPAAKDMYGIRHTACGYGLMVIHWYGVMIDRSRNCTIAFANSGSGSGKL